MPDKKDLSAYRSDYFTASKQLSDITRNMALSGIAIIWLFNRIEISKEPTNAIKQTISLPNELHLPLFLIILVLCLDFLQYLWQTISLKAFYDDKLKDEESEYNQLSTDEAKEKFEKDPKLYDAPKHIKEGARIFYRLKIGLTIAVYCIWIIPYVYKHI